MQAHSAIGLGLHTHHECYCNHEEQAQYGITHVAGQTKEAEQTAAKPGCDGLTIWHQFAWVGDTKLVKIGSGISSVDRLADAIDPVHRQPQECLRCFRKLLQKNSEFLQKRGDHHRENDGENRQKAAQADHECEGTAHGTTFPQDAYKRAKCHSHHNPREQEKKDLTQ